MKNKDRFETFAQAHKVWCSLEPDGRRMGAWIFDEYTPTELDKMVEENSDPTTRSPEDPWWIQIDYWDLSHLIEYGIMSDIKGNQ